MEQLNWLDAARSDPPRARRTDPSTSHIAAVRIERSGKLRAQQQRVLDALKRFPGSTAVELAKRADLDRYMVSRRLPELARASVARRHAPRICSVNGTAQCTWHATERGGGS